MQTNHSEKDEQSTSTRPSSTTTNEKQEQEDEQMDDPTSDPLAHTDYQIEVGKTTVTDDQTAEQYTLWKATGCPVGALTPRETEVSPNLPEAIMGVCEALERNTGGL